MLSPFKTFAVTAHPNTNPQLTDYDGHVTLLSTSDYTNQGFTCSFAKPGNATLSCSVHLAVPEGSQPAEGFDVALDSATIKVDQPVLILPVVVAKGQVKLFQSTSNTSDDAALGLYGNNGTTFDRPEGITYRSEIKTPQEYWQGGDKGGFVWVQLIQLNTTRGLTDQTVQSEVCQPPGISLFTFGLDSTYPYEPTSISRHTVPEPSVGKMYIADGGGLNDDGSGTVTDPCESNDRPSEPIHHQDDQSGGKMVSYYNVREDFSVYQLYKAPGSDSQFVPVQSFNWWWGGHPDIVLRVTPVLTTKVRSLNGGGFLSNTWFLYDSVHDYNPPTLLSSVMFPSWDHRFNAGYFKYVSSGN